MRLDQVAVELEATTGETFRRLFEQFLGAVRGHIGRGRNGDFFELLAGNALDIAQFAALMRSHEGECFTGTSRAAGAANAVNIGFGFARDRSEERRVGKGAGDGVWSA